MAYWSCPERVKSDPSTTQSADIHSFLDKQTQAAWIAACCSLQLVLALNVSTQVKTKALNLLPGDFNLSLTEMTVTPYVRGKAKDVTGTSDESDVT